MTEEDDLPKIQLDEYDPVEMLKPTYTVMLFGPRGSGKSTMQTYLMYCMRNKLHFAAAFTPTADTRRHFEEYLPKSLVFPEFDLEAFKRILKSQHEISDLAEASISKAKAGVCSNPIELRNFGVIMDDCMFDKKACKSTEMRWMFMNGRHENFFHMNCIQYLMDIGPDIRANIDVVIAFPTQSPAMLERLRENLLTCFNTNEELAAVFNSLEPHEALVFDRKALEQKKPYLFFCKATCPLPNFRVCSDFVWKLYYRHMKRHTSNGDQKILNTLKSAKDKVEDCVIKKPGKKAKSPAVAVVRTPKAVGGAGYPPQTAALTGVPPLDLF